MSEPLLREAASELLERQVTSLASIVGAPFAFALVPLQLWEVLNSFPWVEPGTPDQELFGQVVHNCC